MSPRLILGVIVAILVALRVVTRVVARRRLRAAAGGRTGFACPACGETRLVVTGALALPGDQSAASIDLEAVACRRCPLRGVAVRKGGPASHLGYPMTPVSWGHLSSAIASCPAPEDRGCRCAAHRRFGARRAGAWRGLAEVPYDAGGRFSLQA